MKYLGTLLVVKDIECAKNFYCELFDLKVVSDFGANISLSCGLSLQTLETWKAFISSNEEEIMFNNKASELYFEVDDIDAFASKADNYGKIEYVHKIIEQPWGQRAIRLYDMDKHIIEVGEDMATVINRFLSCGLSEQQIAQRMNVPIDFVKHYIK